MICRGLGMREVVVSNVEFDKASNENILHIWLCYVMLCCNNNKIIFDR